MSNKTVVKPLAAAVGTAFMASAAMLPAQASAAENPFALNELSSGYKLAAHHEGKCGEGKCGEKSADEGKCGEKSADEGKCGEKSADEGKCGEKSDDEGKCGEKSSDEGKCGEGKCGS